jgi:DNA-binding transcriptional ArsR family regulator
MQDDDSWNHKAIDVLAHHLSVLGNANRLSILGHLLGGEIQVNALARKTGLGQSALSQHLAILRKCEFVSTRRVSQAVFYSIRRETIAVALAHVQELLFRQSHHSDQTRTTGLGS